MKLLNEVTLKKVEHDRILFDINQEHLLQISLVSQHIARVSIKRNQCWRLPRTWSVAPGLDDISYEGSHRDLLAFPEAKELSLFQESEGVFRLGPYIKVQVQTSPLRLSWFYKGHPTLEDRHSGAYYFSEKNYSHQHYTKREKTYSFYGLGEKAGNLEKSHQSFEMRNLDAMGYDAQTTDPLYKHIPFYQVKTPYGFYGLFYDNFSTSYFNFGKELDNYHGNFSSYKALDGDLDFYVFLNDSSKEITKDFSWLTGRSHLGPKWSLSYSGSTMQYTDAKNAQEKMQDFLENLKEHKILCHSFQLSSGYTSIGDKRYVFNWNNQKFPDPKEFVQSYKNKDVQVCANVKPVLLTDHPFYAEAESLNLFIEQEPFANPELSYFWDGYGSHLNFLNPVTREWWKKNLKEKLFDYGITSIWNDNNEYQVKGEDACAKTQDATHIPLSLIRPVQTLLMMKTSFEAQKEELKDVRAWSISRSGMPGLQRYAQTWSGDNFTEWKTIHYNMMMSLSMSLSGIYNVGHDIGGFAGPKPEAELLLRWIQHGIFYPRFTIHSWNDDNSVTEPWSYPEIIPYVKSAIDLRASLSPYLYTLFYQAHRDYEPIMRPLFWNAPDDIECYKEHSSFLLGQDLLVSTVISKSEKKHSTYLPKNDLGWFDYETQYYHQSSTTVYKDVELHSIPFYISAGSIIPMTSDIEHTYQCQDSQRTLKLYPPPLKSFKKVSYLFEDDGKTYSYQEGSFAYFTFVFSGDEKKLSLEIKKTGQYRPHYKHFDLALPKDERRELYVNGKLNTTMKVNL